MRRQAHGARLGDVEAHSLGHEPLARERLVQRHVSARVARSGGSGVALARHEHQHSRDRRRDRSLLATRVGRIVWRREAEGIDLFAVSADRYRTLAADDPLLQRRLAWRQRRH